MANVKLFVKRKLRGLFTCHFTGARLAVMRIVRANNLGILLILLPRIIHDEKCFAMKFENVYAVSRFNEARKTSGDPSS